MEKKFRELMEREGLTSARLAEALGVQPSGISHILSGRNKPSFEMLQKLLVRFPHVNPDWLLLDAPQIYRSEVVLPQERITKVNPGTDLFSWESFPTPELPAKSEAASVGKPEPEDAPWRTYSRQADEHPQSVEFSASSAAPQTAIFEEREASTPQFSPIPAASSEESNNEKTAFPHETPRAELPGGSLKPAPVRILLIYADGTFEELNRR